MSSPRTVQERLDATYDWAGVRVRALVLESFSPRTTQILDVGAGWGKYRDLLAEYPYVDAVEIWRPYVEEERLRHRYRHVWTCDVVDLVGSSTWHPGRYDLVVLGDVLEHLSVRDARTVLGRIGRAIVAVPFEYAQDEVDGNPHEAHVQDDLTPEMMAERYPDLAPAAFPFQTWNQAHPRAEDRLDVDRPFKGIYVKGTES